MRIIMTARNDPFATYAGVEIFVRNLSMELAKNGCAVHVFHGASSSVEKEVSGVKYLGIKLGNTPFFAGLKFHCKLERAISEVLEFMKFDVIDCHTRMFPKVEGDTPLVYHAHDCAASEYESVKQALRNLKGLSSTLVYKTVIPFEESLCKRADLIIANSCATKEGLCRHYGISPEKVKVIYLGIPDTYGGKPEMASPERPVFLHIAPNHERKGTKYLLESMKILEKYSLCDAQAVIVGKRDPYYVNMARQLNVNADFVGWVSDDELKRLYATCTCLIVPSLRESFCLPILEAASFEKTSIVTNAGALPELVLDGQTSFVVDIGDTKAMAEKMYKVTTDAKLRRILGLNAKRRTEMFRISNIAKQSVDTYEQYLNL